MGSGVFPRVVVMVLPCMLLGACAGTDARPSATLSPSFKNASVEQTGPVTEPGRLKGLSTEQVRAVLGEPGFKRRDAPAEIWQYRATSCTLDLFLYDAKPSALVKHYTVRSPMPVAEKDCFDGIVRQNTADRPSGS